MTGPMALLCGCDSSEAGFDFSEREEKKIKEVLERGAIRMLLPWSAWSAHSRSVSPKVPASHSGTCHCRHSDSAPEASCPLSHSVATAISKVLSVSQFLF